MFLLEQLYTDDTNDDNDNNDDDDDNNNDDNDTNDNDNNTRWTNHDCIGSLVCMPNEPKTQVGTIQLRSPQIEFPFHMSNQEIL